MQTTRRIAARIHCGPDRMMGAGQFLLCHTVVRVHCPDGERDQGRVELESLQSGRTLVALLIIVIPSSGSSN